MENEDTVTLALKARDATPLAIRPGQFNMLYSPGRGEIPVSLSSMRSGVLHHTIRSVGLLSESLCALPIGESIGVRGPFGSHWPVDEALGKTLLIVAGGLGLAPLRPVVEYALDHPKRFEAVYVLYGARDPLHLIYRDALPAWGQHGLQVGLTVDHARPGWKHPVGTLPQLLDQWSYPNDSSLAFICGPEIMMRLAADKLVTQGLQPTRIFLSMERSMKCAVGICGHCQFGPDFLCRDGPVLRYDQIAAFMRVKQL